MSAEIALFVAAFLLAAFAGMASLLRSPDAITFRSAASSFLNSGLAGLAVAMIFFYNFHENMYALIGLCLVIGLGGVTMVDFLIHLFKKGGFSIKLGPGGIGFTESKDDASQ